ncbi:1137_t:CDS:2 [Funneliformis geosporum]|uniref:1137_t:CDS:1 n=1 Tax=Funneliformis geosporum TaxID=1117311 RepID=A0A9W4SXY7_9GLOM|nr:1137_t:CDS:2 [Funneliformis geosporum]
MNLLDPIHVDQSISSYYVIRSKLEEIYGNVAKQLEHENGNHIYLHIELNVLSHIMNNDKERKFIAVSKSCCYLCESYIRFAKIKGHTIAFSGSHKKLYHRWKLPDAFKKEFMSNTLFDLD